MDIFMGTICAFGFNYAPLDWVLCNGQLLPIQQYSAMFALFSTYYGGDGRTTFGVPNLQGRAALGMGTNQWGNYELADAGGAESATLTPYNLPVHNHQVSLAINACSTTGSATSPIGNYPAPSPAGGHGSSNSFYSPAPTASVYMAAPQVTIANAGTGNGSGVPVDTRRPYLAANYSVALEGVYPPRP